VKVLHLTLKKKWFDLIASGVKKEEYREMKDYWHKRLSDKTYDVIQFRNGYNPDSPVVVVEWVGITYGFGFQEWGAPEDYPVYIIKLGEIIRQKEYS